MRVLVVEDEPALADAVARGLRREGMAVDTAADGDAALLKARVNVYDVVVLDRDLPIVHGDEVCRRLVGDAAAGGGGSARILMLTAAGGIDDRIDGLDLGADDYLPKPFAFGELLARIRALARRAGPFRPPVLGRGDVVIAPPPRTATRGGRPRALTPKEQGVLEALLRAGGAVVSAEELLENVWDESVDPLTNTVRVTVMNLRRKLGEPQLIETVVGAGYRL